LSAQLTTLRDRSRSTGITGHDDRNTQLLKKAQQLLIKTFVDRSHLLASQRQAVQEIARIGEGQVGAHILDAMAPGWLNLTRQDINQRLFDAWQPELAPRASCRTFSARSTLSSRP